MVKYNKKRNSKSKRRYSKSKRRYSKSKRRYSKSKRKYSKKRYSKKIMKGGLFDPDEMEVREERYVDAGQLPPPPPRSGTSALSGFDIESPVSKKSKNPKKFSLRRKKG